MTWRDLQSLTWRRMMHLRRFQMCFFFSGFWVSDHIFCPVGLIDFSNITEIQQTNKNSEWRPAIGYSRTFTGFGWVIRTFQIHGASAVTTFFFDQNGFWLWFSGHISSVLVDFFSGKKKSTHSFPQNLKQDIHPKTQQVLGFGCFFFFSDPTFRSTPKKNSKVPGSEVQLWLEELGLGRYFGLLQVTPDGWIGGWVGCKEDAEDLPLDLHPQKEWVGVCIGKWFSLKLFEGCDVNFWEFARKCRKQVKGFLSLLSCSCNFLHCKSISMTDLPVICS